MKGVRDHGAIDAAIARPYTGYYKKIEQKAAALVESVACNHAFTDGNKRTAVLLMNLLLKRSGYQLHSLVGEDLNDAVEQMILDVVNHRLDKTQLIQWFRDRL